jgi:CBS domain-containing protein
MNKAWLCDRVAVTLTRYMMYLADVMRRDYITVAPEDTLGEVAERMNRQNVGAVIVKDFGRLIGILTERDLLRAMAARVHTSDARVRQWMTEDPITAQADMDVEDAAQVMLDNGFRHLPVVDGSTVLGVVSLRRVLGGRRRPASEPAAEASPGPAPAPEAA